MKKKNFLSRAVITIVILCTSVLFAKADTEFYAWEFKKYIDFSSGEEVVKYHNGASLGSSTFTEKDMTVEMWLYIPEEEFVNGVTITSSRYDGNSGFSIDINNNKIRAFFKNVAAPGGNSEHPDKDRIFTMSLPKESFIDQWAHIAFVCSSTDNELRSYLNGDLYETIDEYEVEWLGNFRADGTSNIGALYLGKGMYSSDVQKFTGKMADFRLWNVARSTEEIKANYAQYLSGTEVKLYRNYQFTNNGREHVNLGSAGGTIWFDPDAGWSNVYERHIYSSFPHEKIAAPQNLTIVDYVLSWNNSDDTWEVKIFRETDNTEVFAKTLDVNSISLKDINELSENTGYYAKVRTIINDLTSPWATSEVFGFLNPLAEPEDFYAWGMYSARPGNTDGISCGNLEFTGKDITIELWLNIPTENFTNGVTIASTRHDGTHGFSLDISGDRLRGFFRNDNGDKLNDRNDYVFPFFFAKEDIIDKWVHITLVFSSTNNIARSYLNGEVYEDLVKSSSPYESYNIGWIGNFKADGSNVGGLRVGYFYDASAKLYGKIADLRIWSVGRTDEQIKDNYNKNLAGNYFNNSGLYLNYKFNNYEQTFINDARPEVATNNGWCNPATNWDAYYTREVLAAYPRNLDITDETLSWDISDGEWEVSIFNEEDTEVFTNIINDNSVSLKSIDALVANTTYYAKVRTYNNGVWSGQATSGTFTLATSTTKIDTLENSFTIVSKDNTLIINSDSPRTMTLRAIDGRMVRNINIGEGKNIIEDLAKGIYLINNQKVIIK